ncbi:MAG: aldo/keto reductase [Thermoguttaceae bacterium]
MTRSKRQNVTNMSANMPPPMGQYFMFTQDSQNKNLFHSLTIPMKRRDFLGAAALGAGGLAAGTFPAWSAETETKSTDPVAIVSLTPEVKTTRIGFGTGMRGGNRSSQITRMEKEKGLQLLQYAYNLGIRLFDVADLYGSHALVAEALKDKPRDSYTIVSKIWMRPGGIPGTERHGPAVMVPQFLKELQTDYIDVLQIHCMVAANWPEGHAATMEELELLKKKGMIRAHGISSHSNAASEVAAKTPWCEVIHVRINNKGISMDGPSDDTAARVAETVRTTKLCHDAGKGVIAMKVLGEGTMTDLETRRNSAAFVTNLGCVDAMIIGFEEKEQIPEFIENVALALKAAPSV